MVREGAVEEPTILEVEEAAEEPTISQLKAAELPLVAS
jgi:hypothetical protein